MKLAFIATLLSKMQVHPFRKLNQGIMSPVLVWEGSGKKLAFIREKL